MKLLKISDDGLEQIDALDLDIRSMIDQAFASWTAVNIKVRGLWFVGAFSTSSQPLKNPVYIDGQISARTATAPGMTLESEVINVGKIVSPAFIFEYADSTYNPIPQLNLDILLEAIQTEISSGTTEEKIFPELHRGLAFEEKFLTQRLILSILTEFEKVMNVCNELPSPAAQAAKDAVIKQSSVLQIQLWELHEKAQEEPDHLAIDASLRGKVQHLNLLIAAGLDLEQINSQQLASLDLAIQNLSKAAASLNLEAASLGIPVWKTEEYNSLFESEDPTNLS